MKVGKKVYRGKSKITVKPILVKSISTSVAEKSMKPGEKYSLRVSVSPLDATNKSLKYSSSNTAVASVDGTENSDSEKRWKSYYLCRDKRWKQQKDSGKSKRILFQRKYRKSSYRCNNRR